MYVHTCIYTHAPAVMISVSERILYTAGTDIVWPREGERCSLRVLRRFSAAITSALTVALDLSSAACALCRAGRDVFRCVA